MKKNYASFLALSLILLNLAPSCAKADEVRTLTIYNWQDYIFEGDEETASTIDQFKEYYQEKYNEEINVEYYTFETNENMLNVLKTGKSQYDLVCPSDYTIQKMIKEDMLEPLNKENVPNYYKYASPYIKDIFDNNSVVIEEGDRKNIEVTWSDYAIPFFWGTMGFMYDPSKVNEEDVASWSILWDKEYAKQSTLKDSVRDTYCAGVLYSYSDVVNPIVGHSLNQLATMYENGEIEAKDYQAHIQTIMNDVSDETLNLVKENLKEAKDNVYGFEVDSGKADIVTGKINVNFCWSGDAVYAMDCAEEESDTYLNYVIPKEGSNVWFDGWVMPKGADTELAEEFLNFISTPYIAALNMNEVGYSNSIAGEDIYEMTKQWYGSESVYDEDGNIIASKEEIDEMLANEEIYEYDISYFFGETISEKAIIYTEELNRQLSAQFPTLDEINRCAVMEDFGDRNTDVLNMWSQVKSNPVPIWAYVFIVVVVLVVAAYIFIKFMEKKIRISRYKAINLKKSK